MEYFEGLAGRYSNFTLQVAPSETIPEGEWQSRKGFIHEVLEREYLNHHPDLTIYSEY